MKVLKITFLMNHFNEKFYALLDDQNNNLIELLKMSKSPGIKMNIEQKIIYISEIVYQFYETATKFEKDQINKLLEFIDKQLKFDQISFEEFEDLIFYKQQIDYLEEDQYEDERECIFGYNCAYTCDANEESYY